MGNKMKLILMILSLGIQSCQSSDSQYNSETKIEETKNVVTKETSFEYIDSMKIVSIDTMVLKKFWTDCITSIINSDKGKLKQIVHFPLAGEWGFMIGLNKVDTLWTQRD